MKKGEKISCRLEMPEKLQAPVKKGNRIGTLIYSLGEEKLASYPVLADRNVEKVSYGWCVDWSVLMGATLISVLPILAVYLFAQKYFIEGVQNTGIK